MARNEVHHFAAVTRLVDIERHGMPGAGDGPQFFIARAGRIKARSHLQRHESIAFTVDKQDRARGLLNLPERGGLLEKETRAQAAHQADGLNQRERGAD